MKTNCSSSNLLVNYRHNCSPKCSPPNSEHFKDGNATSKRLHDPFNGIMNGYIAPGRKEVRNPSIAMAMRRITMCEQAGTGMRMMRAAWQRLGQPVPTYMNDGSWTETVDWRRQNRS